MMNCTAEIYCIQCLKKYFPEIKVNSHAATVDEGLDGIRKYKPNIVFLDIQMNGETGFDLLNRLPKVDFALIFTTAYDQYAIKAFGLQMPSIIC